MLDHETPGRKVLNCIKVNVQNRHMIARVSTTAARKPSLSHNASVTSNIYFFLSSFLLCNFLSGSVTVERWINEQGLIWNTWEKLQLKTKCVFIKVWFLPVAATAQSPAAEPSRTPASWAKKMTCMFASCAWEQSWITRYWWWQSKTGGVHALCTEMCVCVFACAKVFTDHILFCLALFHAVWLQHGDVSCTRSQWNRSQPEQ